MFRRLALAAVFVVFGFVAGLVLTGRMRTAEEAAAQAPAAAAGQSKPAAASVRNVASTVAGMPDLTNAAQLAIASVPNISSTSIVRTANSPFANDPFFRDLFGEGYRERLQQSLGSGVVVSSDGYVLTNNHVILIGDARSEVSVTLPDKRELRAKIVGTDKATDLAVLKIEAQNLPVLAWGDSSKLKVAEWVLAVGNPFGVLNQTVTLGIVSATGRSLEGMMYEDFIQTDAAINQGNSGGALINARGELIGINTAIFSQTGGYQGVGFAVPSNLAKHVMSELIANGAVRRGTISGVDLSPMNVQIAQQLKAPNAKGVFVYDILESSDAYAAGVRQYDIIVSFNNVAIEDPTHFMRMLADSPIGGTVSLGLVRNGRSLSVKVPIVQTSESRSRRR